MKLSLRCLISGAMLLSAGQFATAAQIDRAFYRITEGQVHVREIRPAAPAGLPIVILHQSPASSRAMEPLMQALAAKRPGAHIIAPDTLGNGDSPPPAPEQPEITYFADALRRLLDVMRVKQIDLFGAHTGARIATEFAAVYPARVHRLVLDGIVDYPEDLRQKILANYAPDVRPDDYGRQLIWAFNFTRDQNIYSPWFLRDTEHRLNVSMASAEELHWRTVDILKALRTYHKPYLAAFRYVARDRIPLVKAPTLMITVPTDAPTLRAGAAQLVKLLPEGRHHEIAVGVEAKAAEIAAFLR